MSSEKRAPDTGTDASSSLPSQLYPSSSPSPGTSQSVFQIQSLTLNQLSSELKKPLAESSSQLELSPCGRYLVVFNISKINNVVSMSASAASHGFVMILVGEGHADLTERVPDLLRLGLTILRTPTLSTLSTALKAQGIPLIGIEIMKESQTVQELAEKWRETPNAPIALMPGNEGSGLNEPQKKVCDGFVIIPQYGIGTASLNVMVAFTTVAHALTYHQLPPPSTKEKGPGNRGSK